MITVSVISHGHGSMVTRLTAQLLTLPEVARVIVTLNIEEALALPEDPRVQIIRNTSPVGFGKNHNTAFALCKTRFYCVVNPDIELMQNPFPALTEILQDPAVALTAPLVCGAAGQIEDSWRKFPSPLGLVLKAFLQRDGAYPDTAQSERFAPDWIAGMFLLFKTQDYATVSGFDESFFLYYEDVDICVRLHAADRAIIGCTSAQVVHKAQRDSWHSWRYRRYHLTSITRYFSRDWRRVYPALLRRTKVPLDL